MEAGQRNRGDGGRAEEQRRWRQGRGTKSKEETGERDERESDRGEVGCVWGGRANGTGQRKEKES